MVENGLLKFPELKNNINKKEKVVKTSSNVALWTSVTERSWKPSLRPVWEAW